MKHFILTILAIGSLGCITSSSFYTGRTLEPGKFSLGFGADDIIIKSTDNSVTYSQSLAFVPSFLLSLGLPLRFEADGRFVIPRLLEVSLRDQINPGTFEMFDFAPDMTFGDLFGGYTYLRYGGTLSKNISGFEPYVHYSIYHFLKTTSSDFSNSFFSASLTEITNNNRVVGAGVGVPLWGLKFYPKFDYQYFGNNLIWGIYSFGIGIRGVRK
ncbi:MAG TPA: hypothetical protein VLX91_01895 [Candidatus Acidoferrales bacterium]|nr:hypothetical protein [Candidatus Acidoferrales bacterium]